MPSFENALCSSGLRWDVETPIRYQRGGDGVGDLLYVLNFKVGGVDQVSKSENEEGGHDKGESGDEDDLLENLETEVNQDKDN